MQALADLQVGGPSPGVMHDLRTGTDVALITTKMAARTLGKAMATLVVQEHHLWLYLADMRDIDKARFLDAPISQAGLFGDTISDFTQEFLAVKEQTSAMKEVIYWWPKTAKPATAVATAPSPTGRPHRACRRKAAYPPQGAFKSRKQRSTEGLSRGWYTG